MTRSRAAGISPLRPREQPGGDARRPKPALRRVPQPLRLGKRLELLQRVVLDLADPLAGDVERATHLLQRIWPLAGEAEAHLDHLAFALGQGGQGAAQVLTPEVLSRLLEG